MLPGFRFLLAAIVLCISILVFGLGAAALLRAAHEQFAQNPSWRGPPEPRFAQSEEPSRTVLAMLRAEPAATQLGTEPTIATDAPPSEVRVAPAPTSPPAAEKMSAPHAQEISPPIESTKSETSNIETSETETSKSEVPPEPAAGGMARAVTAAATDRPALADTRIAAVEQAPTAANEQSVATAPAAAPAPETDPAASRIASLGRPGAAIEPDAQLEIEAVAEQDQEEAKQRLRSQRAKERRRLAARRAHLAKQQTPARSPAAPLFQPLQLPQQEVTPTQLTQQVPQTQTTQHTAATRRTR